MESATPYTPPEAPLEKNLVFCRDCGAKISKNATVCPNCGSPQILNNKSKVAAGMLAFFLGGFGIHRFYLGQWWGLFYLLFSWTGLPGLISFIEAIVFWCTEDQTWNEKHGNKKGISALIAVLIAFFAIIPTIGILAAIALPAYHDYTVRAKVMQVYVGVQDIQAQVGNNAMKGRPFDESISIIQQAHVAGIKIAGDGDIIVTFYDEMDYGTLIFDAKSRGRDLVSGVPVEGVEWDCRGGTLAPRYRPPNCR